VALTLIIITVLFFQRNNGNKVVKQTPDNKENKYSVETFRTENGGWGYIILAGDKIIIKQDIIPAIQNSVPFKTKTDAEKVGWYVLNKIQNHQNPSVDTYAIDSLKISVHLPN